jgi:hypothetical protein
MAVALLALFVALGGTSYATVSAAFPPNSVGTKQIRDNSVTRAKMAHESITSVLVKDGGLYAKDFATGRGTTRRLPTPSFGETRVTAAP